MTRAAWTDIARGLAKLRAQLLEHAKNSRNEMRQTHVSRAEGVSLAARTVCKVLRSRSRRFDGRRFMRIVGGHMK